VPVAGVAGEVGAEVDGSDVELVAEFVVSVVEFVAEVVVDSTVGFVGEVAYGFAEPYV
jgi:hypothetical protein